MFLFWNRFNCVVLHMCVCVRGQWMYSTLKRNLYPGKPLMCFCHEAVVMTPRPDVVIFLCLLFSYRKLTAETHVHHMQQKVLLLSESAGTQKGETPSRSERIYAAAKPVLHDPFLKWRVFIAVQWNPSHCFYNPVSPLNLSGVHFVELLPLRVRVSLWSSCYKFILGDTERRAGFLFHRLIPQVLWNLRACVGRQ